MGLVGHHDITQLKTGTVTSPCPVSIKNILMEPSVYSGQIKRRLLSGVRRSVMSFARTATGRILNSPAVGSPTDWKRAECSGT